MIENVSGPHRHVPVQDDAADRWHPRLRDQRAAGGAVPGLWSLEALLRGEEEGCCRQGGGRECCLRRLRRVRACAGRARVHGGDKGEDAGEGDIGATQSMAGYVEQLFSMSVKRN